MKHTLGCSLLLFLISCQSGKNPEAEMACKNPAQALIDSFEIKGVQSLSEFLTFKPVNDSTITGLDMETKEITSYVKGKNGAYQKKSHIEIQPRTYLPGLLIDDTGTYYTIGMDGDIYRYNKELKLTDTIRLNYELPILKKEFRFNNYNTSPLIKCGDTMISIIVNKNFQDYLPWFRESVMMEFVLRNNAIEQVKCYMKKPSKIENYMQPWPTYCYFDNTIVMLYPAYDTLYTYNRKTGMEKKIALHNREYAQPARFDLGKMNSSGGQSYQTKYALENFRYTGIYFNKVTKHYVLTYVIAAQAKDKNKAATFDDQLTHAYVLDENFEPIDYYCFDQLYLDNPNYFFYPGKGLALPVFDPQKSFENTKYYIYNF